MGKIKNNEFGSDFHICLDKDWLIKKKNSFFNEKKSSFFLSGRSALYSLIKYGIKKHSWQTLYLPSYYCVEVYKYIKELPIIINVYQYNPFLQEQNINIKVTDKKSSVIINVDFFGFKKLDFSMYSNICLIDDLSHNLLAIKKSTADYVFGSLRKELPVPVGGVIYSEKYKTPQGKLNLKANQIALQKLTAMYLKNDYLQGNIEDKSIFRKHFFESEINLESKLKDAGLPRISKAILQELDILKILNKKKSNLKLALGSLIVSKEFRINEGFNDKGFGLVFKFKSLPVRNALKSHLINNNIFPAILWPNQKTDQDKDIEDKVLFVHIDFRHTKEDVIHIVNKINMFFQNEKF